MLTYNVLIKLYALSCVLLCCVYCDTTSTIQTELVVVVMVLVVCLKYKTQHHHHLRLGGVTIYRAYQNATQHVLIYQYFVC